MCSNGFCEDKEIHLKLILAWCRIYASWKSSFISLVTHICVANPSISLIGPGGDLQNSVRPRWVNTYSVQSHIFHICSTEPHWVDSLRPSDAYVSGLAITCSTDGLAPVLCQAITSTNADFCLMDSGVSSVKFNRNSTIFYKENAFKTVVCKWKLFHAGLDNWTHWPLVMPYGIMKLSQHWLR